MNRDEQNQGPKSPESDPYTEPSNSTVEDWTGHSVERDTELVDQLVEEADGDLDEAEARYEQMSDQGASTNQAKNRPTDDASARGRTQGDIGEPLA